MKKHYDWKIGDALPELKHHSRAKHAILDAYVHRYIEICTATPVQEVLNLTIVDGFSGGGRYQMAGEEMSYSRKLVMALMGGISWRCSHAAILSREKDMPHDEVYHHAVARSIGIFV